MKRRTFLKHSLLAASAVKLTAAAQSSAQADSIIRSSFIINGLDVSGVTRKYVDTLLAANVACWHKTMGDLQSFANGWAFVDENKDRVAVTTTAEQIRQARKDDKLALVFGWQGAEYISNDSYFPRTSLRAYYQLGLRVCSLVYNTTNVFGGGCLDPSVGLTRAGQRLVEEIHKLGIILDLDGHCSEKTSLDALAISSGRPVICSHTNMAALNDNPRCISDRVAEAIAKTGGVIGLTTESDFMKRKRSDAQVVRSPQATLDDYLDQYDYLKKLVGIDHIGFGPDFVDNRPEYTMEAARNYQLFPADMLGQWPLQFVKGFEDITKLPTLVNGLLQRGWTATEIRQMLGENWLRVMQAVWLN